MITPEQKQELILLIEKDKLVQFFNLIDQYEIVHPNIEKFRKECTMPNAFNIHERLKILVNGLDKKAVSEEADNMPSVIQQNTFHKQVSGTVINKVDNVYLDAKKVVKPNVQPTDIHITQEQGFEIKRHLDELIKIFENAGKINTPKDKSRAYQIWGGKLKRKFKVTNRNLIPKEQYDEVIAWLKQQKALNTPKLRRTNKPAWANTRYKAIWSKQGELNLSKEEVYRLAEEQLNLKKPIVSLKQLGERDLDKFYKIMMAKKRGN